MAAQRGKDLLLKVADATGAFVTVAGLRTQRLALNAMTVDATSADSLGGWRELLAGAGVRKATINGGGIFKDSASDALMRQIFFDGVITTWQVIVPAFGIIQGLFQIAALDWRGDQASELTFELSLESAGPLAFAPA